MEKILVCTILNNDEKYTERIMFIKMVFIKQKSIDNNNKN